MNIFPIYPHDPDNTSAGCLNIDAMVSLKGYSGHFRDRIERAMQTGDFIPTPGLWCVIDIAKDGDLRGMIFTLTDTDEIIQGVPHTPVRLTTWPPKT